MSFDEHDSVAVQFGVASEQVERDHLISHLLAAISRGFGDRVYFIGGTALLDAALPRSVARSYRPVGMGTAAE
ncbi:hypothetical protein [Nocardia sp. NBC_00511]|uniref:hypothetical protein n=1 Tax=Nocardia sp. NBC_00511 TaxID=2903591 RepID=UPI0030E0B361